MSFVHAVNAGIACISSVMVLHNNDQCESVLIVIFGSEGDDLRIVAQFASMFDRQAWEIDETIWSAEYRIPTLCLMRRERRGGERRGEEGRGGTEAVQPRM